MTPRVQPLPPAPLGTLWAGRGEGHAAYAAAAGEEDIGVREYRHGDDLRRIHWRATAHHGELMVRREEHTWHSQCTILLDSRAGAHRGTGPAASYEWAVSAAASAAVHLLNQGYLVRLSTGTGSGLIPAEDQDTVARRAGRGQAGQHADTQPATSGPAARARWAEATTW